MDQAVEEGPDEHLPSLLYCMSSSSSSRSLDYTDKPAC